MDKTPESQAELNALISRAVRQDGAPRAEAMKSIGAVLANPPASLIEMVKSAGVDLRQVQSGDKAQRRQIADLLDRAIGEFGESSREVRYAISATLHPGHPLSPNRCHDASTQRGVSR
jgi:hypothetical protein